MNNHATSSNPTAPLLLAAGVLLVVLFALVMWWTTGPEPTHDRPRSLARIDKSGSTQRTRATNTTPPTTQDTRPRLRLRLVGKALERRAELVGVVARGIDLGAEAALPTADDGGWIEIDHPSPSPSSHIAAWTPDRAMIARTFTPDSMPSKGGVIDLGDVDIDAPTGLDITLTNTLPGHDRYRVRFMRVFDNDQQPADDLARRIALRALDEALWLSYDWPPEATHVPGFPDYSRSVTLSAAEPTRVWPLFPDAATRLVLFAPSGEVSTPLDVGLSPRTIQPLSIDIAALFPHGARGCVTLDGRLVRAGTHEPIAGASITREDPVHQFAAVTTDRDGAFRFDCVPNQTVSQFRVRVAPGGEARPSVAREQTFRFVPPLFAAGSARETVSVRWEVAGLHWLIVAMDATTDARLRRESRAGFPRQFAQRWSQQLDAWESQTPDELAFEAHGFAVGLSRPGRWRAVLATNPLELHYSDEVIVEGPPAEHRVRLAARQPQQQPRSLLVTSRPNNYPVDRLEVGASVAPTVLGWSHFITDAQGTVVLGVVNADAVTLRLGMPPADTQEVIDLTRTTQELIEITLDTP